MFRFFIKWEDNLYFSENEFKCRCCGLALMSSTFIYMLTNARHLAGVPFIITSGFRCFNHNKLIKGSETSSHLKGDAADIACDNGIDRSKIVNGLIKSGFKRIGIYKNFIHADFDQAKQNNIWIK